MAEARGKRVTLQTYRDLYAAVGTLAQRFFDEALEVNEDEQEAAFAASCRLISELGRESLPSTEGDLLASLNTLAWPRRRPVRASRRAPRRQSA